MTSLETLRYVALSVGLLQLLANVATLLRGPARIRAELAAGAVSERFADLLSVAWVYGGVANLCLSGLLLLLAGALRERNPLAWRVTAAIGGYYIAVGIATYSFGIRRHTGLLAFVVFGAVLLLALWASRKSFAL